MPDRGRTGDRRASTTNPRTVTDKVRQQVVRMYQDGQRVADITEATGLGQSSIYWVLDKAGVERSRIRRPTRTPPVGDVEALLQRILEACERFADYEERNDARWRERAVLTDALQARVIELERRNSALEAQNTQLVEALQRLAGQPRT